jgi:hypothetical protein
VADRVARTITASSSTAPVPPSSSTDTVPAPRPATGPEGSPAAGGRSNSTAAGWTPAAITSRTRSCTSSGVQTERETHTLVAGSGWSRTVSEAITPSVPYAPQSSVAAPASAVRSRAWPPECASAPSART